MKPGDMFQVVRPTKHIEALEGRTKASRDLGLHYLDIGQVEVMTMQSDFALARVANVCTAIELGDIMIPFEKIAPPKLPTDRHFDPFMKANGNIRGTVVMTRQVLLNYGSAAFKGSGIIPSAGSRELEPLEKGVAPTGGIVYVDLGRNSGVKMGDIFIVYRQIEVDRSLYGDIREPKSIKDTKTAIGEIVILKVNESASTALVTYSSQGISAGDSVVQR